MAHTTPWCMHMALIIQLLLASMLVLPRAESSGSYHRAELIHVDANGGFTREELIRRAADRAHLRAAMLSSTTQDTKMKVEASFSHYEYLMRMEVVVASEKQSFSAVADTGSDFIWTKKEMSSTTVAVPCRCTSGEEKTLYAFNRTYGGGHKAAQGFLCSHGKLRFLSSSKTETEIKTETKDDIKLGFAIHYDDHLLPVSAHGIVGLNRGENSLLRQLKEMEHIANKFSYCLNNSLVSEPKQVKSPFWFGSDPPISIDGLTSTPLAQVTKSPFLNTDWYYVELFAISIDGGEKIKLQANNFKHKSQQGNGVMFIDSGCSHTKLETRVFKKLKNMLGEKLKKMLGEEQGKESSITKYGKVHTCFPVKQAPALDLVLHLGLDGAEMRIPWDNYMVQDKPESRFCLTINETAGVSIMGNILQHDIYMHYDLTQEPVGKLSFKKVDDCSKLL